MRDDDDLDLSAWQVPPPPAGLVDGVMARVDGTGVSAVGAREVPATRSRRRWGAVIAAAIGGAAIAAAIAFAVRGGSSSPPRVEPGSLVAAAPSTVAIAPGTSVTVSEGAALSWRLDDHGALHVTQTAGAISYQHQPGRHLVVHAGTARVEADDARMHVEVPMAISKQVRAGTIGAALATVIVVAVYEGRAALSTNTGQVALDTGAVGVAPPADPPTVVAAAKASPARDVPTAPRRFASQAARSEALDELAKAKARRELRDRVDALNSAAGAGVAGGLDPDDVRAAVKEILPLMAECFDNANPGDVHVDGELVARLSLISEPDVGTLIADADLSEGDAVLVDDAELTECLHETLMSLELPPLPDGGTADIDYPFAFSKGDAPDSVGGSRPIEPPSTRNPPKPKDPEPEPAATAPGKTVDELITEANNAARAGKYPEALDAAMEALRLDGGNQQALTAAAIAACNMGIAAKAVPFVKKLSGQRRGMIIQVCKRNKIMLDDDGNLIP